MNPIGLLIVAIGVFSAATAIFDWDWVMNTRQARLLSSLITRRGARVVYGLLGFGATVVGVLMTTGIIAAN
jgi:hypothetical protein